MIVCLETNNIRRTRVVLTRDLRVVRWADSVCCICVIAASDAGPKAGHVCHSTGDSCDTKYIYLIFKELSPSSWLKMTSGTTGGPDNALPPYHQPASITVRAILMIITKSRTVRKDKFNLKPYSEKNIGTPKHKRIYILMKICCSDQWFHAGPPRYKRIGSNWKTLFAVPPGIGPRFQSPAR